jgi:Synergist-CTERM protein sorting domain-containing protein
MIGNVRREFTGQVRVEGGLLSLNGTGHHEFTLQNAVWIQDGVFEISSSHIMHDNRMVIFHSGGNIEHLTRRPTFRTTWTGDEQGFQSTTQAVPNKITVAGDNTVATIDVRGTAFNIGNAFAPVRGVVLFNPATTNSRIVKAGPGTIRLWGSGDLAANTWHGTAVNTLEIQEGYVHLMSRHVIGGQSPWAAAAITVGGTSTTNVEIDAGGTLVVREGAGTLLGQVMDVGIRSLNGAGRIILDSDSRLNVNNGGTFSGVISGAGAFSVSGGTQVLSGTNTYSGNTFVWGGAGLSINRTENLGNSARLHLAPRGSNRADYPTANTINGNPSTFTVLATAAEEVVLPAVYLGNGHVRTPAGSTIPEQQTMLGEVNFVVAGAAVAMLPETLSFNQNTFLKQGTGRVTLDGAGTGHTGNTRLPNSFVWGSATNSAASLVVQAGVMLVRNAAAASGGNILVMHSPIPSPPAQLFVSNGLNFAANAVRFDERSVFGTSLTGDNFGEDGVPAARFNNVVYNNSVNYVFHDVNFDDLVNVEVLKGEEFHFLGAGNFTHQRDFLRWIVLRDQAEPAAGASELFALKFDDTPGRQNLYLEAMFSTDMPSFGAANPISVDSGAAFVIRIPVESNTGINPARVTVAGLTATAALDGDYITLTGTAPVVEANRAISYTVRAYTLGDAEWHNAGRTGHFTLTVVADGTDEPKEPTLVGTLTHNAPAQVVPETEIEFTVVWTYTDEDGNAHVVTPATTVEVTGPVTKTDIVDGEFTVTVDEDAAHQAAITVKVSATHAGLSGESTVTLAVYDPDDNGGDRRRGGGGCSTGFAGLALFLAVPLFFRKKD